MRIEWQGRAFSLNRLVFGARIGVGAAALPFRGALCPLNPHQSPASHKQIRQRTGHEQSIGILGDAAVAHLVELEHALHHTDRVLDARAYSRTRAVDPTLLLAQVFVSPSALLREVLGRRRTGLNLLRLARIGIIAPHPGFASEQTGLVGIPGAAGILIAQLAGRWLDRRGAFPTVTAGACLVLAAYVVFGFAELSIIAVIAGAVLLDCEIRATRVANQTLVTSVAPDARSRFNTVFGAHVWAGTRSERFSRAPRSRTP